LANHTSALKRHRQSLKRQARNKAVKTRIKNAVKAVRQALAEKSAEKATAALTVASSVLDKAASNHVIHWKKAGRSIARLQTAINKMAA
jgi:small subunit ribosomal protein S20